MLVQRDILSAMLEAVESAHGGDAAWRVWDRFDRPSEVRARLRVLPHAPSFSPSLKPFKNLTNHTACASFSRPVFNFSLPTPP